VRTLLALLLAACTSPKPAETGEVPCDCGVDSGPAEEEDTWVPSGGSGETVILVSLDGFRRDYLERADTPYLDALAAEGVLSDGLVPAFPSKTFPNHVSIATGLYPAHHGIVGNRFRDPELGLFEMFDNSDNTDPRFWLGEPIWISAEKDGVTSATLFWTGSEVDYDGWHPTYRVAYDGSISFASRVDRVLGWLDLPEADRPRMITLYMNEPDHTGHAYGASHEAIESAVQGVDGEVGRLVQGLIERDLYDRVHVLVVSDHGMADTGDDKLIFVDDYADLTHLDADNWGPWVPMRPSGVTAAELAAELADVPHALCATTEDLPARLHYFGSDRIAPVHCIAEVGWSLTTHAWADDHPGWHDGGTHGYDPENAEMHGIFIGRGPRLQAGLLAPTMDNVHLYGLMAEILGVRPAEHDGDPAVWGALLAP
jgi:predicted AlkP superfamily pyrophosphatase or phosphodiesterase